MDNFGWGELGCLRWRRPARRADAAHRQARLRRDAPAQLQRRGAMHAQPRRADDRPLCDSHRQRLRADRHAALRTGAVGSHDGGDAVRRGLCDRHLRQVASRPHRRPLPHRPGLRRVVRHPQLHPTNRSGPTTRCSIRRPHPFARVRIHHAGAQGRKAREPARLRHRRSAS